MEYELGRLLVSMNEKLDMLMEAAYPKDEETKGGE